MISSGRKVNDSIPKFIVKEILSKLKEKIKNNKILLLELLLRKIVMILEIHKQ